MDSAMNIAIQKHKASKTQSSPKPPVRLDSTRVMPSQPRGCRFVVKQAFEAATSERLSSFSSRALYSPDGKKI